MESETTHDEDYYSFLVWGSKKGGRVPSSNSIFPGFSFTQAQQESQPVTSYFCQATWLPKEGFGQNSQEVGKYPSHVTRTLQTHALRPQAEASSGPFTKAGAWTVPPWYSYRSIFKTARGSHNQGRSENPWPLAAQCVVPVQPTQQLLGASWQCKPSAPSPGPQNQTPHFTRLPR